MSVFKQALSFPVFGAAAYFLWVLSQQVTGAGFGYDEERFAKWWPASYHLIGKDILTTHTVYWPTFLMAAGIQLPKKIFAHGWLIFQGDKMSKSKGNVVAQQKVVNNLAQIGLE